MTSSTNQAASFQLPALPTPADPIDEFFNLDPLDPSFDEDKLQAITRKMVDIFRGQIAIYNQEQAAAAASTPPGGKKKRAAGGSIKAKQQAALAALAPEPNDISDLF
jgi:hypothetical protein